jgi:hypothetical protein
LAHRGAQFRYQGLKGFVHGVLVDWGRTGAVGGLEGDRLSVLVGLPGRGNGRHRPRGQSPLQGQLAFRPCRSRSRSSSRGYQGGRLPRLARISNRRFGSWRLDHGNPRWSVGRAFRAEVVPVSDSVVVRKRGRGRVRAGKLGCGRVRSGGVIRARRWAYRIGRYRRSISGRSGLGSDRGTRSRRSHCGESRILPGGPWSCLGSRDRYGVLEPGLTR